MAEKFEKLNLKTGDVIKEIHIKMLDDNADKYNNFIDSPDYIISDEEYNQLEKFIFNDIS